ncbi:hypothetical protein [Algoriphagus sanaruensis]|uniref:Uncharacterized protein n=1 Tax=Algoriphagus sanaruensis TaxID=1727163 RepID=A0A142EPM3_9BACT|nr:hypothetical protein [Algoriphagus sanaruensis]AMQ57078.1 hypothetical protein AO498_11580 [Algoriphagus sanaruensis]
MSKFKFSNSRQDREKFNDLMIYSNKDTKSDSFLHRFFWEKIKYTFISDESTVKYTDNEDNILIFEDELGLIIIGFLGIDRKFDRTNIDISNSIITSLLEFDKDIRKLAIDKGIDNYRLIYFTTYKLSDFKSNIFSKLPIDVSYFYLANFNENKELILAFENDLELIDIINYELEANQFLEYAIKRNRNINQKEEWYCELCGGNNFSGCQYFDPTECPNSQT